MTSDASQQRGSQVIGIDLGGTAIKLARFTRSGELLAEAQLPTPQPAVPGAVTMALCEAVEQLDPQHHADVVGIGLPGPMDTAARVARVCINLPGWEEVPLADWLEPRLERRVTLANDGNCAVVGEAWLGAAQGYADVVLLTLGTGVGGGVLLNGSLFTGHNGAAAEPGLIGVDPEGPACNSGNRGSLEQFASIGALRRLSERDPANSVVLRRQVIRRLLRSGLAMAPASAWGSARWCTCSRLSWCSSVAVWPEMHRIPPALRREVETRVQAVSREGLRIEAVLLGNGAGRLGAARLALQRLSGMMSDD